MTLKVGTEYKIIDANDPYAGCIGTVKTVAGTGGTLDLLDASGRDVKARQYDEKQLSEDFDAEIVPVEMPEKAAPPATSTPSSTTTPPSTPPSA